MKWLHNENTWVVHLYMRHAFHIFPNLNPWTGNPTASHHNRNVMLNAHSGRYIITRSKLGKYFVEIFLLYTWTKYGIQWKLEGRHERVMSLLAFIESLTRKRKKDIYITKLISWIRKSSETSLFWKPCNIFTCMVKIFKKILYSICIRTVWSYMRAQCLSNQTH